MWGQTFAIVIKMPTSHITVPDGFKSQLSSPSQLLANMQSWEAAVTAHLGPCHPHRRPQIVAPGFSQAQPQSGLWGVSQ